MSDKFLWTNQRIALVKHRHACGETYRNIASGFGISKAAVIGAVFRDRYPAYRAPCDQRKAAAALLRRRDIEARRQEAVAWLRAEVLAGAARDPLIIAASCRGLDGRTIGKSCGLSSQRIYEILRFNNVNRSSSPLAPARAGGIDKSTHHVA